MSLDQQPAKKSWFSRTLRQAVAATAGASFTAIFVTPFDVARVRIQAQKAPVSGQIAVYGSPFATMRTVVRNEGLRSLWRGLGTTMSLQVPATGLYYVYYDQTRQKIEKSTAPESWLHFLAPTIAGTSGRIIMVTLGAPFELVRTNLQATGKQALSGPVAIIRQALRNSGWRGLFLGLGPTIARDAPFSAIYWLVYERFNRRLQAHLQRLRSEASPLGSLPTPTANFLAGASAGCVAAILTNPIDVVKTRVQIRVRECDMGCRPSAFAILRETLQQEGPRALASGLSARLMRVSMACALMISSYEAMKAWVVGEE